jgi:hypothetical protein
MGNRMRYILKYHDKLLLGIDSESNKLWNIHRFPRLGKSYKKIFGTEDKGYKLEEK